MTLANKVRALVEQYGSQKEVAERLGVHPTAVGGWLKGTRPRHENAKRVKELYASVHSPLQTDSEEPAPTPAPSVLADSIDINGVRYVSVPAVKELAKAMRGLADQLEDILTHISSSIGAWV